MAEHRGVLPPWWPLRSAPSPPPMIQWLRLRQARDRVDLCDHVDGGPHTGLHCYAPAVWLRLGGVGTRYCAEHAAVRGGPRLT